MSETNEPVKLAIVQLKDVAQRIDTKSLRDLTAQATKNLVELLKNPEGPFAQDPELALKAYTELSKAENAAVEAQRRTVDTLIKAKSLLDPPPALPASNEAPAAPQISDAGNSIFE